MTALPLWKTARARNSDPDTSHKAAASVEVVAGQRLVLDVLLAHSVSLRDVDILNHICSHGGKISPSGVRSRLIELEDRGLARRIPKGGLTDSGRLCQTWEAVR